MGNDLIIQASATGIAQNYILLGRNYVNDLKPSGNINYVYSVLLMFKVCVFPHLVLVGFVWIGEWSLY
jgi:hypothetical protein